jgi:hypothetical protein
MMAAREPIEEGVHLLILQAGWNGNDILADRMAYNDGRVLTLDLVLLYRLYPLAVVELGSLAAPTRCGGDRFFRVAGVHFSTGGRVGDARGSGRACGGHV